jgi:hypothetical protein
VLGLVQDKASLHDEFGSSHRAFLEPDREPDVVLSIASGSVPPTDTGEPIYDLGILSYHRVGAMACWRQPGPSQCEVPRRLMIINEDLHTGQIWTDTPEPERDGPALYHPLDAVLVNHLLVQRSEGITLHATGVDYLGRGLLFVGFSGAGKSTMAGLWRDVPGARLLCDDRIIVRLQDGQAWMYGTPWHSKVTTVNNIAMPVDSIFVIRHGTRNEAKLLSPGVATVQMMARSFLPFWDAETSAWVMRFVSDLATTVPCYDLGFVPDRTVIDYLQEHLSR